MELICSTKILLFKVYIVYLYRKFKTSVSYVVHTKSMHLYIMYILDGIERQYNIVYLTNKYAANEPQTTLIDSHRLIDHAWSDCEIQLCSCS